MALPLHSHQSLLERGMSEGHEAAEQAQSPVKMFLALITVPIDPKLIPAQIRLILLVASAFCRPIALWSIPAQGWPIFFTLLVPYRCLTVSPDKRQALPKHWFPIDFYLSQLSLALSHPRCIYLQLSSLSSNHTSTKLRREWSHQHFKDISTAHKENTTCRTDSFSNPGFALERTRAASEIHPCSRQHRQAGGGERGATDATATWRETAPSIICWSPDDGGRGSDYRGEREQVRLQPASGSSAASLHVFDTWGAKADEGSPGSVIWI